MTKTVFSDGTVDVYKGKRDVQAGWAILIDGKVRMSGHSMDRMKAEKTARGNARYLSPVHVPDRPNSHAAAHAYWGKKARKEGFASWKEWYDAKSAEQSAWIAANCKFEIVDVQ